MGKINSPFVVCAEDKANDEKCKAKKG